MNILWSFIFAVGFAVTAQAEVSASKVESNEALTNVALVEKLCEDLNVKINNQSGKLDITYVEFANCREWSIFTATTVGAALVQMTTDSDGYNQKSKEELMSLKDQFSPSLAYVRSALKESQQNNSFVSETDKMNLISLEVISRTLDLLLKKQ